MVVVYTGLRIFLIISGGFQIISVGFIVYFFLHFFITGMLLLQADTGMFLLQADYRDVRALLRDSTFLYRTGIWDSKNNWLWHGSNHCQKFLSVITCLPTESVSSLC